MAAKLWPDEQKPFVALVDKVTIHHGTNELKGNMEFCFRNGMKYNYFLN